jgi:hypothetical protein
LIAVSPEINDFSFLFSFITSIFGIRNCKKIFNSPLPGVDELGGYVQADTNDFKKFSRSLKDIFLNI